MLGTGSITPTQTNCLIITILAAHFGAASITGTPSIVENLSNPSGLNGGALAYAIQTTPAAVSPVWTLNNTGFCAAVIVSVFRFCVAAVPKKVHPMRGAGRCLLLT